MPQTLGEKVRYLRKKKGMTLEELANTIGSGKSYIWELENRGVRNPSAEKLAEIARTLDVTPEYLLDDSAQGLSDEDLAVDQAFFRKYQRLPAETKAKIRKSVKLFWEDDS